MQFKVLSRHSAVQMEEGLAEKWFTMAGGEVFRARSLPNKAGELICAQRKVSQEEGGGEIGELNRMRDLSGLLGFRFN